MAGAICIAGRRASRLLIFFCCLILTGCETAMMSVLSVGASTGINYTLNGIASRTFTASADEVHQAASTALGRMGIEIQDHQIEEGGQTLHAQARDWVIELYLEPLSSESTRMRASVNRSWQLDKSTAIEIVEQTAQALEETKATLAPVSKGI